MILAVKNLDKNLHTSVFGGRRGWNKHKTIKIGIYLIKVNSILTGGADYAYLITTSTPVFLDLLTALQLETIQILTNNVQMLNCVFLISLLL